MRMCPGPRAVDGNRHMWLVVAIAIVTLCRTKAPGSAWPSSRATRAAAASPHSQVGHHACPTHFHFGPHTIQPAANAKPHAIQQVEYMNKFRVRSRSMPLGGVRWGQPRSTGKPWIHFVAGWLPSVLVSIYQIDFVPSAWAAPAAASPASARQRKSRVQPNHAGLMPSP